MWVALQQDFCSFLKLGGIAFVWALEEVPQVPMINEQRCSVVVLVVLLGTSHIYCLWTDFRVGRGLANPFLPSIQPSACAMPSRCLCCHARVRPLPAQATSVPTYLYNPPAIAVFSTVPSPAYQVNGFFPFLFTVSLWAWESWASLAQLHPPSRGGRETALIFSFSIGFSSCGSSAVIYSCPIFVSSSEQRGTWKAGFLKSFGTIKFSGCDTCMFCREIRPLTYPLSPTSGTWG